MSHSVLKAKSCFGVILILAGIGCSDGAVGADTSLRLAQLADEMQNIGIDTESDTGKFLRSTRRERAGARREGRDRVHCRRELTGSD